jgi:hypothetical protein
VQILKKESTGAGALKNWAGTYMFSLLRLVQIAAKPFPSFLKQK